MIYTDSNGQRWNLDRKAMRRRDVLEGRERLIGEQVHAYKQVVAALNALLFAEEHLEKRLRKQNLWSSFKLAMGCIRRVKMKLAEKAGL